MDSGATAARMAPPQDGKQTCPSPEEPAVATSPSPLDDVVDSALFGGGFLDPRSSDSEAVLGDDDDEIADEPLSGEEDENLSDTYDDDDDDSDIEFEEDDDDPLDQFGDGKTAGSDDDLILAPVEFLGEPARFATVDSTAGFMLLRAGDADAGQDGGEITVHYRYVRFTKEQSGGPGVEVFSGAKLHPVRFLVPNLTDPASSLRLAGAALADMVYPRRFSAQLQALWSNLVAAAPVGALPPRVEATVSVGILRRRDLTPERMASVRAELAAAAREGAEAWPFLRNVGVVTRLPAPVKRPAKRRRLEEEEEEEKCAICHEVLERGLAAWPQCEHVFHGECCEQLLVSGHQRCPLCRMELNVPVQR